MTNQPRGSRDTGRRQAQERRQPRMLTQEQSQQLRAKHARKKRRQRMLYRVLAVVLTCAAALIAISVFFRVSTVTVSGERRYSASDLIRTSGIHAGDPLLFIRKGKTIETLEAAYPYLDTVVIDRHFPSSVEIEVTERKALLAIRNDGGVFLLDKSGKVLEKTDQTEDESLIAVIGVKTTKLEVGMTIRAKSDDEKEEEKQEADKSEGENKDEDEDERDYEKIRSALEITALMEQYEMLDKVVSIDVTRAYAVSLNYANRYTVELGELGEQEVLEHKIQFLQAILREKTLPNEGTIDLSGGNEARYRPTEEGNDDSSQKRAESAESEQQEEDSPSDSGEEGDSSGENIGESSSDESGQNI